jgi:hypothetical protein
VDQTSLIEQLRIDRREPTAERRRIWPWALAVGLATVLASAGVLVL